MSTSNKTFVSINLIVVGVSLVVWILLLANPTNLLVIKHCPVTAAGPSPSSLNMLLDMNPIGTLLLGWAFMVIAMMLPKLVTPIDLIYGRSFRGSRFRLALLFVLGYISVWTATGLLLIALSLGWHLLLPSSFLPAIGLGIVAAVWQCSPLKQRCLNRGHSHPSLAAFGWTANRDSFLFGLTHGLWCVGAGWALMLLPMLLPVGHNLAMVVVTVLMISEHLESPQSPRWRLAFPGKLLRIALAQTQLFFKGRGRPSGNDRYKPLRGG